MAIYHLRLKTASRKDGGRAAEHAKYIAREGRYASARSLSQSEYQYLAREGQHCGRINELVHLEHQNMPSWVQDNPVTFWQAADRYERANGRLYSELEISLPRELDLDQRLQLAQHFAQHVLGARHPYTLAVHNQIALDGGEQPHAHLMFCERRLDTYERPAEQFFKRSNPQHPDRGGAGKDRDWSRKDKVAELRQTWEAMANAALKQQGLAERIDRRSLIAQGIEREPEPYLGPTRTAQLKQGQHSDDSVTEKVIALRDLRTRQQQHQKHASTLDLHRDHPATTLQPDVHPLSAEQVRAEVDEHVKRLEAQLKQAVERRNQLGYSTLTSEELARSHAERIAQEMIGGDRWLSAEATLRSTTEALEEINLQCSHLSEFKAMQGAARLLPWNALSLGAEAWALERRHQKAQADYDAARETYNLTLDWLNHPEKQERHQQLVDALMSQYENRRKEHRELLSRCQHLRARLGQERLYALSLHHLGQETFLFRKTDQGRWMPAEPKQFIEQFVATQTVQQQQQNNQQSLERKRVRQQV